MNQRRHTRLISLFWSVGCCEIQCEHVWLTHHHSSFLGAVICDWCQTQFDPLDLSQYASFDFLRKAELSNGRSAMLATVGWSFPTLWTFPDGPVDTTDPIEAFWKADPQWWAQFLLVCGTIEGYKYSAEMNGKSYTGEIGKEAAIDWTGNWSKMSDAQKEDMAIKELKNARLAMIGMAGYFASVLIPGSVPALS
jgi:Chlorophyll A-B binding protein